MPEIDEWSYCMRRTMQQIIPGLYLGPFSSAVKSNVQSLVQTGITHIVCVRQDVESTIIKPHFPDIFR